ncbi:MAG: leucine-rich repeat domain-containing protein [Saprospiraceae bacterium]
MTQLTKFELKKELINNDIIFLLKRLHGIPQNLYNDLLNLNKEETKLRISIEAGAISQLNHELEISALYKRCFLFIDDIPYDLIPSFSPINNLNFPSESLLWNLLGERKLDAVFNILEKILLIDTSYPLLLNELLILRKEFIDLIEKQTKDSISNKEFETIETIIVGNLMNFIDNIKIETIKNDYESNKVKYLIQQAKHTHSKILDIGNLGLDKIPTEVFKLTNLEVLIYSSKWYDYETKEEKQSQNNQINNQINHIPQQISKLKNLKALYLGGDKYPNYISDLSPLNELQNLQVLDVHNNRITKINFSNNLKSLKYLDLSENKITSIQGIVDFQEIQYLNLAYTKLDNFSFIKNLSNLSYLNLRVSKFSELDLLKNLTSLEILNLRGNYIENIDILKNLTKLKNLDLSDNRITEFDIIKNLVQLENLDLSELNLSALPNISKLSKLQELKLNYNYLSTLESIQSLTQLKYLELIHNRIKNLSYFKPFTNLEYLNLSDNKVLDLKGIESCLDLKILYLTINNISNLEDILSLKQLEKLDLSNNNISDLEGIQKLDKLRELDLSYNPLMLNVQNLSLNKNLIVLYISNTKIQNLEVIQNLVNLKVLSINSISISNLEGIQYLTKLESLYINNLNLAQLNEIRGLKSLKTLHANHNKIVDLKDIQHLVNIQILKLEDNKISDLDGIENLSNLKYLSLGNNKISDLEKIQPLQFLQELYLNDNNLSVINKINSLQNLRYIHLQKNHVRDLSSLLNRVKYGLEFIRDIQIFKNRSEKPPIEVIEQGRDSFIKYFSALEDGGNSKTILKVILAGNSGVGKTSMVRWLTKRKTPLGSTHWLHVHHWQYKRKISSVSELEIRFFDFGGQAYYHDTHHLFYTSNTIYLLIWNHQTDQFDSNGNYPLKYWLEAIKYFAIKDSEELEIEIKKQEIIERKVNFYKEKKLLGGLSTDQEFALKVDLEKLEQELTRINKDINGYKLLPNEIPALIIQNKIDENGLKMLNNLNLTNKYQNIYDFTALSIKTKQRSTHFKDIFHELISNMSIHKWIIPDSWNKIMNTITEDKEVKILSITDLKKKLENRLNQTIDINILQILCKRLYQIGDIIFLNNELVFTDIAWLIEKIKDINNDRKIYNFNESDIESIVGVEYINKIVTILLTFKILIKVSHLDKPYILPLYLPKEPERGMKMIIKNFNKKYQRYRFDGFVHKSIILNVFSEFAAEEEHQNELYYFWRNGLILQSSQTDDDTLVLVQFTSDTASEKRIEYGWIDIKLIKYPKKRNEFIHRILKIIDKICEGWSYDKLFSPYGQDFIPKNIIKENNDKGEINFKYNGKGYYLRDFKNFLDITKHHLKVFISYSRHESEQLFELYTHLKPFERNGVLKIWYDRKLVPSEEWKKRIKSEIKHADIIIMLISPAFLASDFIMENELTWIKENENARIVQIILEPCHWELYMSKIQTTLSGEAVSLYSTNRNEAWYKILEELKQVQEEVIKNIKIS